MTKSVIILGAGGHAKVIADIVLRSGCELLGFLADGVSGSVLGLPVMGGIADIHAFSDSAAFVIGIGDNRARKRIADECDVRWHTAVHPSALIAGDVEIGEGSVAMAGAIINSSATVGRHCIINTASVIDHDSMLGDFVHISPHATLCGTVNVGELTHIGAGAVIKNKTSVGRECVVGAGAVVIRNIYKPGVYAGVPVRRIR